MSESAPDLHMLNVVVGDMSASLDFYRRLGVALPGGEDATGVHVQLRMPRGFSLELDTADSARLWHAGWRADPASARVVIGFSLPTREAVDDRYAELTSAGYVGRQPPFDAFWGARYAIVADPDGNDVGLMSPLDESRRTWPPEESPAPVPAGETMATMNDYEVLPIGRVESQLKDRAQAPRQGDEGAPDAWLVFVPAVGEGIRDLAVGTEIIVLTWLDRAVRDVLITRPRDDPGRPPTGVFSTRSPDRPNPIGLHRVQVVATEGLRILVRPLEALDGTPVIDIKPVLDRTAER